MSGRRLGHGAARDGRPRLARRGRAARLRRCRRSSRERLPRVRAGSGEGEVVVGEPDDAEPRHPLSTWDSQRLISRGARPDPGAIGLGIAGNALRRQAVIISAPATNEDLTLRLASTTRPTTRRPHRGLKRVLHHELPGPAGQGAAQPRWRRPRCHDVGPRLHARPEPSGRPP
jgi:hypothetical protein